MYEEKERVWNPPFRLRGRQVPKTDPRGPRGMGGVPQAVNRHLSTPPKMSTPSTPVKKITFVVNVPIYAELTFKKFVKLYNGTQEQWDRLVEKAGKDKEFVEDASAGVEMGLEANTGQDVEHDACIELHELIEATIHDVEEEIELEKEDTESEEEDQ